MFSGATPRDGVLESPRDSQARSQNLLGHKGLLNAELNRIFRNRLGGRALYDTLLMGVEAAALGVDRVHACEARQRDAEAVLRQLEEVVASTDEDSMVILEEDNPRTRSGRKEVTLAWAIACIETFQKAIAALEAFELLARRACRHYDVLHAARLTAHEQGSAQPATPRTPRGGVPVHDQNPPETFMQMHSKAAGLQSRAKDQLQELSGPRRPLESWRSWFGQLVCAACTTRAEEADHSQNVVDNVNSMHLRALQAEKGDILCCTPIYVDLDGVRYRSLPEEDGRVLPIAVKRGEKVNVKGRQGDWIWNGNGYLPLKHPVDGSVLFLFDHKRSSVGDSDSSDSESNSSPAKSSSKGGSSVGPRSPRGQKKVSKLLKPHLQAAGALPSPRLESSREASESARSHLQAAGLASSGLHLQAAGPSADPVETAKAPASEESISSGVL